MRQTKEMGRRKDKKMPSGFTLVELSFSMIFIALLMISMTMTIIQIINTYNRGLLMKEVNQVGRTVTDQMQRTISSSTPSSTVNIVKFTNPSNSSEVTGGRLCLGNYSYIYNFAKTLKESSINTQNKIGSSGSKVGFIRIPDEGGNYCKPANNGTYNVIPAALERVDMLSSSAYSLTLYNLGVVSPSSSYDSVSGQRLYYIDVSLGTSDYKAIEAGNDSRCKAPSDEGADQNYCSISSFPFVARAGNI